MPLVLEEADWNGWLDASRSDLDAVAPLLSPRSAALVSYRVDGYVNDPRHDDPKCLEPAADGPQQSLF
jgi:putative SOS response-associated peptidase YedK